MSDETQLSNVTALKEIAETLNQSLDLRQALHDSLEIILKILRLKAGWVFLKDEDSEGFTLATYHGLPPALHCPGPAWDGACSCNSLAVNDKLNEAVNIVHCSRLQYAEGEKENLAFHASVPLETPRSQIGILNVAATDGRLFREDELQLLNTVGNQMGVAIERARMFEQTREQRLTEQAALLKLSDAFLNAQNLEAVVDQVVTVTGEIFSAEICALLNRDQNLPAGVHGNLELKPSQLAFLQKPWREDGAAQTILSLGRSGHIQLAKGHRPKLTLFPAELPVPPDASRAIIDDQFVWEFWGKMGCKSMYLAPIQSISKDEGLGLLVVAYKSQRQVSEAEVHLINLLANQASLAIEQTQLQEIRLTQEAIEKELNMAQEIQHSFLPKTTLKLKGWQIATRYKSARQVGGDFYDLIPLENDDLGIVIADVADKGVPAALVMALSRTLMRGIASEDCSPAQALTRVNEMLVSETLNNRFVTFFYGVLNPRSGQMTYARAGHNPPFYCKGSSGQVESLFPAGMALGIMSNVVLEEETVEIEPGDVVVFYTDGVTEAMNAKQKEFTETRLRDLVTRHHQSSAERLAEIIESEVAKFVAGTDPSDDFTLVVIKRFE